MARKAKVKRKATLLSIERQINALHRNHAEHMDLLLERHQDLRKELNALATAFKGFQVSAIPSNEERLAIVMRQIEVVCESLSHVIVQLNPDTAGVFLMEKNGGMSS